MNHRARRGQLALGIAAVLLLRASPAPAADDLRAEIEAVNRSIAAAVGRGDGSGMAGFYTEDAKVLPPESGLVTGSEAIGAFWQGVFDGGVAGVSRVTLDVEGDGDTAYEVGEIEIRGADGAVLDRGKYVVVWKKEGASWKLHRDIWNTSVAPKQE